MKDEAYPNEYFRNLWENLLKSEQKHICDLFEAIDSNKFKEEIWFRKYKKNKNGGGGVTRILQNGNVFEKCAVNYSCVFGKIEKDAAKQMCVNQYNREYINTTRICHSDDINSIISKVMIPNVKNINEKYKFYASGISIIAHPINPNVPSIHSNFRFFQIFIKTGKKKRKNNNNKCKIGSNYKSIKHWFGGGCDLSPCYIFSDLFKEFHNSFKVVCDKYNHLFYKYFKIWCDLYFRIRHRNMNRGIGGIFFDNLLNNNIKNKRNIKSGTKIESNKTILTEKVKCKCYSCNDIMDKSYKMIYLFVQECIIAFRKSYFRIILETFKYKYDDNMIKWQSICRGRYVEFNLIYDRGTKFGIQLNDFKTYRRKKKENCAESYSASTNFIKDEIFDEQISDYESDEHEKIDNVFSSLPTKCEFVYKFKVAKFSREYETLQILKHPKKWIDY